MNDEILTLIVSMLVVIPFAVIGGNGLVYVFNHIPASWLCDYGKEPEGHLAEIERRRAEGDLGAQRLSGSPWKLVLTGFFLIAGLYMCTMGGHGIVYVVPLLIILWLLMLIAVSDGIYMIIPDQFVVFLMLMSVALLPFGRGIKDMLFGALAGAGLMLLVALVGFFLTGRESLGFGDVKLMAAVGLITGFYECIGIMVVASILSSLYFLFCLATKRCDAKSLKPLGPYLAGVTMASIILL